MRFRADEAECRSCQEIYSSSELDRYLWCPGCRRVVRVRAARWARIVGFATSLGVITYLALRVQPSPRYTLFYAVIIVLTFVLTSRIAAAIVQGYYRSRGSVANEPPPGV